MPWPARSTGLNPIDFCVCGVIIKNEVYTSPVKIEEALLARIMEECISIREKYTYKVKGSMHKRARACGRTRATFTTHFHLIFLTLT